jgi:hypothetical protein
VEDAWNLTEHVCRECLGRIVVRAGCRIKKIHRCASCGLEAAGPVEKICACGCRLKEGSDVVYQCVPNSNPSPGFPVEITVAPVPTHRRRRMRRRQASLALDATE